MAEEGRGKEEAAGQKRRGAAACSMLTTVRFGVSTFAMVSLIWSITGHPRLGNGVGLRFGAPTPSKKPFCSRHQEAPTFSGDLLPA